MQRMQHLRRVIVFALLGSAGCAAAVGGGSGGASGPVDLETLWAEARGFDAFLEDVRTRREAWHETYHGAVVDDAVVERLAGVPGPYRLLAVSLDGCTDSFSSLPYMARLAERVPGLELRIIDASRARALMERHPTPDGRAATPTIVLLDERSNEVGCWIERPAELQSLYLENKPKLSRDELYEKVVGWYARDGGRSAVREIAAMVEAADNGERACP